MAPRTRSRASAENGAAAAAANTGGVMAEGAAETNANGTQDATNANPVATTSIRPYEPRDLKELQLIIGMRVFEQLPVANRDAYMHPIVLAVWFGLSGIFIQVMDWWPRDNIPLFPYAGYLTPLLAFAPIFVPIIFLIDWLQRPYFEKQLREELTAEDLLNIPAYYLSSSSKYSRFTILEWKNRPIGYIGIDAETPDATLTSLEGKGELDDIAKKASEQAKEEESKGDSKQKAAQKQKQDQKQNYVPKSARVAQADLPSHAVIRHFHVDRVYQQAGVHYELATTVIDEIFAASSTAASSSKKGQVIDTLFVRITSVQREAEVMWARLGFQDSKTRGMPGAKVANSGVIFGEQERWLEMSRTRWESLERIMS